MGAGVCARHGIMKALLHSCSRWLAIALAFAIPVSTALDNILMGLLFLAVLAAAPAGVLRTARYNPAARAALLLFAILIIALAWSEAPLKAGIGMLGKYADLLLVPMLMVALRDASTRRIALRVFLAVMAVTALLSWGVGLSILPAGSWMWSNVSANPAIFRSSITQNILMAYAVYLILLQLPDAKTQGRRWGLVALAVLMGGDVLIVKGRTGYLVLLVLLAVFGWQQVRAWLRARGRRMDWRIYLSAALVAVLLPLATYYAVPRVHSRVEKAVAEFHAWNPAVHTDSSIGERMEFYRNTAALVARHPLLGYGTGAFEQAYAREARSRGMPPTQNPHEQYLLLMVQAGLPGLLLLLYLFYVQWRHARDLPTTRERYAARGLVFALAITGLFNSPLMDHTEGIFYAFMSAYWFTSLEKGAQA